MDALEKNESMMNHQPATKPLGAKKGRGGGSNRNKKKRKEDKISIAQTLETRRAKGSRSWGDWVSSHSWTTRGLKQQKSYIAN